MKAGMSNVTSRATGLTIANRGGLASRAHRAIAQWAPCLLGSVYFSALKISDKPVSLNCVYS